MILAGLQPYTRITVTRPPPPLLTMLIERPCVRLHMLISDAVWLRDAKDHLRAR